MSRRDRERLPNNKKTRAVGDHCRTGLSVLGEVAARKDPTGDNHQGVAVTSQLVVFREDMTVDDYRCVAVISGHSVFGEVAARKDLAGDNHRGAAVENLLSVRLRLARI